MNHKLNCVLAIDDDEATNFFTRIMLEDAECADHVVTLQSGRKALDYLVKNEAENDADLYPCPDLIFLDINMPAMDGWEFLEEYKKLHLKSRVIVVMLTTSLFSEDRLKAEAMPEISCFENKPLTAEKIAAILEKYFTNATANNELISILEKNIASKLNCLNQTICSCQDCFEPWTKHNYWMQGQRWLSS